MFVLLSDLFKLSECETGQSSGVISRKSHHLYKAHLKKLILFFFNILYKILLYIEWICNMIIPEHLFCGAKCVAFSEQNYNYFIIYDNF